jgi:MATE family multidrug resistance protein
MARLNGDILVRSLLLTGMFVIFTFQSARLGDVALATNQVLLQFLSFVSFGMDGFAFAAEALVARAIGRGDVARLRAAVWLCGLWSAVLCVAFALGFALFGGAIIDLMATSEDVRSEGRVYLVYIVLVPLVGLAPFLLDGIFIGATRGADMRNMMVISTVIYFVAVWVLAPSFGNHGLWGALILSFVARGVTLGLRYPALERAAER